MQNNTILEYIWLDSDNDFRSKARVIDEMVDINDLPIWNYDGSSTNQAVGSDSEVFLKPSCIFKDPFRGNNSYLVWCDMLDKNSEPLNNSNRQRALSIFNTYQDQEPWFGLEQEYFIINPKTGLPVGFDTNKFPEPQGRYYCGVGYGRSLNRIIPETHLEYCLHAGIKICGINAEVAPGQWEYQIGPCVGIDAGDHLWVSRYILNRVAELYGCNISYHPKPLGENADWNGSGCHTNYSTKAMRKEGGITHIHEAITRLSKTHQLHMANYGKDNQLRMSGKHETSSFDKFTFGVADRSSSVRIPNDVAKNGRGYFEDRRPAANCDPYLVTSLILQSTMIPHVNSVGDIFEIGYIV